MNCERCGDYFSEVDVVPGTSGNYCSYVCCYASDDISFYDEEEDDYSEWED